MFVNFYRCACGFEWLSQDDSMCDSRCPAECGRTMTPLHSQEIKTPVECVRLVMTTTYFALSMVRVLMETHPAPFKTTPLLEGKWEIIFEKKHDALMRQWVKMHLAAFPKDTAEFTDILSTNLP